MVYQQLIPIVTKILQTNKSSKAFQNSTNIHWSKKVNNAAPQTPDAVNGISIPNPLPVP